MKTDEEIREKFEALAGMLFENFAFDEECAQYEDELTQEAWALYHNGYRQAEEDMKR